MEGSFKTSISLLHNCSRLTASYHVTAPEATREDFIQKPRAPMIPKRFFLDLIPVSNIIPDI